MTDNYTDDLCYILITKPNCPLCELAKEALMASNADYFIINGLDNLQQCKKYNIKKTPSLLVCSKLSQKVELICDNLQDIKKAIY